MQHESSSVTLNIVAWIFFGFKLTSSGPCILSYFDALNSATKLSLLKGTLSMFFHALPRCSAFQMGCQPFGHQTRKHLVMISGLGLNFQLLRVYYELTKWPAPSGLIAQLVEHCTGIAEVMGSNPVQAWMFFSGFNNCDDQSYLHGGRLLFRRKSLKRAQC